MPASILAKKVKVSGVQSAHRRGHSEAERVANIKDLAGIATGREAKQVIVKSVTISFEGIQPLAKTRRVKRAGLCERTQDEISRKRIRDIEIPSADIFRADNKVWRKCRLNLTNSGIREGYVRPWAGAARRLCTAEFYVKVK